MLDRLLICFLSVPEVCSYDIDFRMGLTMQITMLTFIAFYLDSAMDSGRYDDLSIDEVKREIEAGTIFPFLRARLEGVMYFRTRLVQ
ncbi:hypothetical protein [Komagataeibacter kakiaceti]|uniref:hypothetical protein n=1 Tax=Komagataeibacter kakiaceti TaxID=943261 RepID=UPI00046F9ECF|nr:hypothetical protein [Komagataeibacter kakiaceti]